MGQCIPCLVKWAQRGIRGGTLQWDKIKPHIRTQLVKAGYNPKADQQYALARRRRRGK